MNIEELEVRNKVYDLGLTKADFDTLRKELQNEITGEVFVVRKNGKVFGIKHGGYDEGVIVETEANIPSLPYYRIAGLNLNFQLSSTDTESIIYFTEKALKTRTYGESAFGENPTFTNIKRIKEGILSRILTKHKDGYADIGNCETHINEYTTVNKSYQDEALKAWFWLFNEDLPEKFQNWQEMATKKEDLSKIVKVWERDNVRYALSITKMRNRNTPLSLRIYSTEDERYNYIDENRLFLDNIFVWWDLNENEIEQEYLEKCGNDSNFVLVNKEKYQQVVRRYRLKVEKEKEETETKSHIESEFYKRIKSLGEKPFIINGLKLSADKIEFEEHEISGQMEKTKWNENSVEEFIQKNANDINNLDFNTIFNQFCEKLQERTFKGILGKVKVEITKETTTKDNDIVSTRYSINGIRINKDEVVDVIKRAICFDEEKDFNSLVQEVSKCSLKFHDMLSNGLNITFHDRTLYWAGRKDTGDCVMKLNVVRKGSRNFLRVGTEEYKISDTNKLLTISDANKNRRDKPDFETIMKVLHEMFNLSTEKVGELIKEGMKEHLAAVKRSEEFLAETIKILKAEKTEKGYLIRGKSGREYLISEDLRITDHNSGRYICIVDKTLGQGFLNDRLVNRMYALANDTLVEISTLKR